MREIIGPGIIAASFLIGLTGAGMAAPVVPTYTYLGVLSGAMNDDNAAISRRNVNGPFQDDYGFTLLNPYSNQFVISISATDGFSNSTQAFSSLTLDLYAGLSGSGTPLKESTVSTVTFPGGTGFQVVNLSDDLLAGNYSFSLTGDVTGTNSYGGALSVSVSAVPLPASAPLLGMAVLALGALGFARTRKPFEGTAL